MGLDDLKEVIEKLQGIINTRHDYLFKKEARTRQVLIDPLLGALGWDVSDPGAVYIEHNRMDYALMSNATLDAVPVAVIEAKPLGESLEKKAITQAIAYAIENNVHYIIVTDGDRWEMYEVLKPGTMEDKKLMEFQLSEHLPQECVLQASRIWKSNLAPEPVLDSPDDKMKDDSAKPTAPALAIKKAGKLPVKTLYLEYWTALKNHFEQRDKRNNDIKFIKTLPQCFMPFAVGHSGFHIHTWASRDKRYINVGLTVKGGSGEISL